jgi:hypothetical protein
MTSLAKEKTAIEIVDEFMEPPSMKRPMLPHGS